MNTNSENGERIMLKNILPDNPTLNLSREIVNVSSSAFNSTSNNSEINLFMNHLKILGL